MKYNREIYDQITIQYIILFTLNKADRIITHDQLTSLVLDCCNIKFTEFRIAVDNLEKIGHIRIFSPDGKETYCELLPAGCEASGFFEKKIPIYIREPIEEYIPVFFREETVKRSVRAELLPLNERETPLMKLAVYAGTRKYANSMIREFKKNPQKLYETVIELIGNNLDETENEDG